jgi:hypothetical protein
LHGSEYRHVPRRASGIEETIVPAGGDDRIDVLARVTATLNTDLEGTRTSSPPPCRTCAARAGVGLTLASVPRAPVQRARTPRYRPPRPYLRLSPPGCAAAQTLERRRPNPRAPPPPSNPSVAIAGAARSPPVRRRSVAVEFTSSSAAR